MARLYEYADTSDKSGYFLRGGSSDGNYTMRATELGRRLFDRLDYEPGIVNEERGPRIPTQLQWAMYDVGLLKTGNSNPSGTGFEGEFEVENTEITEEMMAKLKEFVRNEDSAREEVQNLAEILDIDSGMDTRNSIWAMTGSDAEIASMVLENRFGDEVGLGGEESDFDVISVHHSELYKENEETSLFVIFTSEQGGGVNHRHSLYFTAENGFEGILSTSDGKVGWTERARLERHRADIIEAVRVTCEKLDLYFGDPTEGVDFFVNGGAESETIHERAQKDLVQD